MSSPMDRPTKTDRRAAARTVEQACADGTIVVADRDLRLQQVESAQSLGELDVLVRGLSAGPERAVGPTTTPTAVVAPGVPPEPRNPERRGYPRQAFSIGPRTVRIVPAVIALVVISGVGSAVVSFVRGVAGTVTSATASPSRPPLPIGPERAAPVDAISVASITDMVGDVRARTGATQVHQVTIFPDYAVLQLPAASEQQTLYRWDGDLGDPSATTNARGQKQIDLATIDPAVVVGLSERARKRVVADPTTWYVIIRPPLLDDQAVLYAYASNAAQQGGYISAKADGTVVRRVTW